LIQKFTKENINKVEELPGVYKFLDRNANVIYVGKAKNLRNRLNSYLHVDGLLYPKTAKLLEETKSFEVILTSSEIEAFILEQNLIRKFDPKYNIKLKDNSSYPYVVIETVKTQDIVYKKVYVSRKKEESKDKEYIGPYADAGKLKQALRVLRRIFPYTDCSRAKFNVYAKKQRPCVYGQIGLCPAICVYKENQRINNRNVLLLKSFLLNGQSDVVRKIEKQMRLLIKQQKFEEAQNLKHMLIQINSLYAVNILKQPDDSAVLLPEDVYRQRVYEIKEFFGLHTDKNWQDFRIECYDISNIMGKSAVGSMVVSVGGKIRKDLYRRFKIKTIDFISDPHMMQEVLKRRFSKTNQARWGLPDILLIDGGRTQLSMAKKVLAEYGLLDKVLLAGIFKPNDDFYILRNNRFYLLKVKQRNTGIEHLRALRDEAHRYAKQYFKKLFLEGHYKSLKKEATK